MPSLLAIHFLTLLPLLDKATAYTCAKDTPLATCASLASAFSASLPKIANTSSASAKRIPTITITLTSTRATPASVSAAPASATPATTIIVPSPVPPRSIITSTWVQSAQAAPHAGSPSRSIISPISTFVPASQPPPPSQWSTCIDHSPFNCANNLCTAALNIGECTPWVEGDGPARDLCLDGEAIRCHGSECFPVVEGEEIMVGICDGYIAPAAAPPPKSPSSAFASATRSNSELRPKSSARPTPYSAPSSYSSRGSDEDDERPIPTMWWPPLNDGSDDMVEDEPAFVGALGGRRRIRGFVTSVRPDASGKEEMDDD